MSEPWNPEWQRTLGDVEHAVAAALAGLDRYEAAFAATLQDAPAAAPRAVSVPSDDGWDARLAAARAAVEDVDRHLIASEAAWARWAAAFSAWRGGIQQPQAGPLGGASDGEVCGDPAGGGPVPAVRRP